MINEEDADAVGRDTAPDVHRTPDTCRADRQADTAPKAQRARRSPRKSPKPAPDVRPPAEPDGFDPFDPAQVAAAPQLSEILAESDPDRPTVTDKFPVTNFRLHPGGCLGTFPFVGIPEKDGHSFHPVDARITTAISTRGGLIKMKRLYRAMIWNPDIDAAECVVVRSAPFTPRDHTANWFVDQERVVRRAESGWVNVTFNQKAKRFRIANILNAPDTDWREVTPRDFIAEAFHGLLIKDLDNPLLSHLNKYKYVDPK
jgi:hypothetical protein